MLRPWQDCSEAVPSNLVTGKPYRGINVIMLYVEASLKNYTDSRWLTFKQASEIGTRIRKGEQVLIHTGAVICHGGNRAFYRPSDDIIQLPPSASFSKPEDYYATALHELCHWTGHPHRLNRVLTGRRDIEAMPMKN